MPSSFATTALAISARFTAKIGGPSVKPHQPPGYWVFLNFPNRSYEADKEKTSIAGPRTPISAA